MHRGTPTHVTYPEPEREVYKTYDMVDEATDTTSLAHDTVFTVSAVQLELERLLLEHHDKTTSPDWEQTAEDPGYDDEASSRASTPTGYHAVEPHIDNAELLEHEHPSLWHEMQAVDEGWAAAYKGEPDLQGEMNRGMYTSTIYSPSPPPAPWYPPQPPTTCYGHRPDHF